MGLLIINMGESGVGKSRAWKHIPHDQAFVISPNGKSLPFQGAKRKYKRITAENPSGNLIVTSKLSDIGSYLDQLNSAPHIKYVLIDDFTHFFNARTFSSTFRAQKETDAFGRWDDFGADVFNAVFGRVDAYRDDLYIVLNHHTDMKENGVMGFKTQGKLIDRKIDPISYVTYQFHALTKSPEEGETEYVMLTNREGPLLAKTPEGCFPEKYIPNDMYAAIQRIEAYEYGEEEQAQVAAPEAVQQ